MERSPPASTLPQTGLLDVLFNALKLRYLQTCCFGSSPPRPVELLLRSGKTVVAFHQTQRELAAALLHLGTGG